MSTDHERVHIPASPTQGATEDKPAEARAAEIVDFVLKEVAEAYGEERATNRQYCVAVVAHALSSPKEGATATGADAELLESLRANAHWDAQRVAEVHGSSHPDANPENWDTWQAAALIESLQRKVATAERLAAFTEEQLQHTVERAEAAESSLRSLGAEMERAREALYRISIPWPNSAADPLAARIAIAKAALTPKQAIPSDLTVSKSPQNSQDAQERRGRDSEATPSSPSDESSDGIAMEQRKLL